MLVINKETKKVEIISEILLCPTLHTEDTNTGNKQQKTIIRLPSGTQEEN